jgi:hypothetical protein
MLNKPQFMIALGFILVVLGWILPFLMVLHIIKSTFFWNFFSFGASVAGVFLGILGTALYSRRFRE